MKKTGMALLVFAVAAAACNSDLRTGVDSTDTSEQLQLEQRAAIENANNMLQFEALVMEISPYIIYNSDGSWMVADNAVLGERAKTFAAEAQAAYRASSAPGALAALSLVTNAVSATPANQSGLTRFWWGYRIGIPTGIASGVSDAYTRSGGPAAVRMFVSYYGAASWVGSIAAVFVPAYAITINYVDKRGGRRGVFANVPWTILPTVITAQ